MRRQTQGFREERNRIPLAAQNNRNSVQSSHSVFRGGYFV